MSVEWYQDDLQGEPDAIEAYPYRPSVLAVVTRLAEQLDALQKRAQPPSGTETLDLRDER